MNTRIRTNLESSKKYESNVYRKLKEGDTEYQKYFRKELEKTGKSSPADMTDDEKRTFFTKVDKGWTGKTESVNEYDEWKNTRIQAKNIFRMLKQKYNNNISKMKDGLELILKQNKTKDDQAEVMRDEFNKFFNIKTESVREGLSSDVAKHMNGIYTGFIKENDVKKKINRRGESDGLIVNHNGKEYHVVFSADGYTNPYGIVMPGDDTVSFINRDRNVKFIWKTLKPKVDKFIKSNPINENLSSDVAKHIGSIYKGFIKVEGDGTMIYDSPANAARAAKYLNSKKIAASSDGKYLYIESINEGNAFGMAVTKAKEEGKTQFEFNGKTYKVKKGSYEKNEAKNKQEN